MHLDFFSRNKTKYLPASKEPQFWRSEVFVSFSHFFFHSNLNSAKENREIATPGFRGAQWCGRSPKATSVKAHQVPFSSSSSRRLRRPLPVRGTAARNGLTCHFTTWKLNSPCLILPPAIVPSVKWASDASSTPSVQTYGAVETLEEAEDTLLLVSWPHGQVMLNWREEIHIQARYWSHFLPKSFDQEWHDTVVQHCLMARRLGKKKIINTYKNYQYQQWSAIISANIIL